MNILIANPNTSRQMLDLMVEEGRASARTDTTVDGVVAEFGVPYIATPSELAIAGHALLDVLSKHHQRYDAVIVGAFCHAIVAAAKELMPIPVIGLAEASLRAAQLIGTRIGVIGLGASERAPTDEIGSGLDAAGWVATVRNLPMSGTELAANQPAAEHGVVERGLHAVAEDGADVLILGGAAFAGMAPRIADRLPVPVVSPVRFAVGMAELMVASEWRKPEAGPFRSPGAKQTDGLSPELAAFFAGQPGT